MPLSAKVTSKMKHMSHSVRLFNNMIKVSICKLIFFTSLSVGASTIQLSPNGYSGLGLIPIAETLRAGDAVVSFDPTLPGASSTLGYNTQIGLGLYKNFELIGRLATNDLKCNMFKSGACPANNIRDFSASLKWSLPIDWLKQSNASVALGVTDVGGAASYFKSYYVVGTKRFNEFELSLGNAQGKASNALLKGNFGAIGYRPNELLNLSVQRIGSQSWFSASVQSQILNTGLDGWLTFNQRLSQEETTEKKWVGVGISLPMDRTSKFNELTKQKTTSISSKIVKETNPADLAETLQKYGFYNPKIGHRKNGTLVLQLENSSYHWNILDAAGVSLGIITGALAKKDQLQNFEIVLTSIGIPQVLLKGEAQCAKKWLEDGQVCNSLSIASLNQSSNSHTYSYHDGDITWTNEKFWSFRPEIILSPTLVNAIGTEYGAFDIDTGVNVNTVLPLWAGATLDTNRVNPLGVGTRGFEASGVFYGARLKPVTNRTLIHQLVSIPSLNTQARFSLGTAYTVWEGRQIETSSQSNNGRHKFGVTAGSFKTDTLQFNNEKNYQLTSYRYVHDSAQSTITELTQGKFWGGDKGFSVAQRFWHGDTALNIYIRRTRMTESSPLVSFAGLQFSIPFTPRENRSFEHLNLRGTSQWTYTLESRIFDKENRITGGYGEIPKMGDSLVQTFNRDRNSTAYLENSLGRIKNAFVNLGTD
jgi:hypothetical protein